MLFINIDVNNEALKMKLSMLDEALIIFVSFSWWSQ